MTQTSQERNNIQQKIENEMTLADLQGLLNAVCEDIENTDNLEAHEKRAHIIAYTANFETIKRIFLRLAKKLLDYADEHQLFD